MKVFSENESVCFSNKIINKNYRCKIKRHLSRIRYKPIKTITPHTLHSRIRVVGYGGDVELCKIKQEVFLSRSSMFFDTSGRSATLNSIFVVVCDYVTGIYSKLCHMK